MQLCIPKVTRRKKFSKHACFLQLYIHFQSLITNFSIQYTFWITHTFSRSCGKILQTYDGKRLIKKYLRTRLCIRSSDNYYSFFQQKGYIIFL